MDDIATQTKAALRRLAKSVAVITASWNGQRYAMAATAVEGLSLDPPSMLLCIARTASIAAPLDAGAPFAINLLASDHENVSARGGAPWQGEERFALGDWDGAEDEAPILRNAQASFRCSLATTMDYGTHRIIVGRIDAVRIAREVDPLIYIDGRYRNLPSLRPEDAT